MSDALAVVAPIENRAPVISRAWCMPSRHTFTIKPIASLLERHGVRGGAFLDPFAGFHSPARFQNDLNPDTPATHHMDARDYIALFDGESLDGALVDPPYSPRQIMECYRGIGRNVTATDTQSAALYAAVKDALADRIRLGGIAICCGWNSQGFGKGRGYELIEILLVAHGGAHNDTIVTVERRVE